MSEVVRIEMWTGTDASTGQVARLMHMEPVKTGRRQLVQRAPDGHWTVRIGLSERDGATNVSSVGSNGDDGFQRRRRWRALRSFGRRQRDTGLVRRRWQKRRWTAWTLRMLLFRVLALNNRGASDEDVHEVPIESHFDEKPRIDR